MTSTEWQLPTLPSIVSSTDLFDGDLFGDELIGIYNGAMDVGEVPPTIPSDDIASTLLPQDGEATGTKPEEVTSTSSNALPTLLPAPGADLADLGDTVTVVVSTDRQETNQINADNKRVAVNAPAPAPPAKKRSTCTFTVMQQPSVTPPPVEQSVVVQQQQVNKSKEQQPVSTDSTPNPLLLGQQTEEHIGASQSPCVQPPVSVTAPVFSSQPITGTNLAVAAPAPAVVSPQTLVHVKNDVVLSDGTGAVTTASPVVPVPALSTTSAATTASSQPQRKTTEADFKSVAQAAVSSLIMNAVSSKADSSTDGTKQVNTSTAHIKNLTGSNWVEACFGGSGNAPAGITSSAAAAAAEAAKSNNNRGNRRQNLTPDERAKQNRDRNREHARNTRLRKKAYVEELKLTLTELVAQRDAAEMEKRTAAQREVEQREVRFRVIEEFLKLRGRNEPNFARWAAILEDGFSLTLPMTGFRKMVNIDSKQLEGTTTLFLEQVLTGVSEIMDDSSNFASFLQSFGSNNNRSTACSAGVSFVYNCDRKDFFMDGSTAVLDWTASSVGAMKQGARTELSLRGTLRAKFDPASNKLISANLSFDTGLVQSQLNHHLIVPAEQAVVSLNSGAELKDTTPTDSSASSQADAILDSLQMPHFDSAVVGGLSSDVTVVPPS